jgi:hypothetical protein
MITSTDVPAILGARFPLLKIEKKKMINGSVITIKIIFLASTFNFACQMSTYTMQKHMATL